MKKLGALDANFLYSESRLMPNHVASVQRFELPEGITPDEYIAGLKDYLRNRLHLVPYLTRRLKYVPGNLDHPFWVRDKAVDLDDHVIEVPLPEPGTVRLLEQKIAELHAVNMDRSRPLWAIYVVTGLEDGSIAFYNQVHHAAIDGMAGQAATQILMDNTPDHPPVEAPQDEPVEDDGVASLLQLSLENLVAYQIGATSRWLGSMETMRRMVQRAIDPSRAFGALVESAPRTRFNEMIGKERSYAVGQFPFAEARKMGKQLGCTMNDIFMAVCAGGLRRYLQRHDELPGGGLIAGCPVSLRRPNEREMGNNVTMMRVNLATHIADAKQRLLAIHESARIAKEVTADLAESHDPNAALPGLPAMMSLAAAAAESSRMATFALPPMNVVISNVPGPRETLYCNGARMLTHYPVSIPAHGVGLNITVQSYAGTLYFGVTGCARALPDADQLRDDMVAAYLELRQALLPDNVSTFKRIVPATEGSKLQIDESITPKVA